MRRCRRADARVERNRSAESSHRTPPRRADHFYNWSRQYPDVCPGNEGRCRRFSPEAFQAQELLASVERALRRSAEQRRRAAEKNHARGLLERLTPREFQVMQLVITGLLNKQVGAELGMAEKTVKTHRGHIMQKLGITSVAELIGVVKKAE